MKSRLRILGRKLTEWAYPSKCTFCGEIIDKTALVCASCAKSLKMPAIDEYGGEEEGFDRFSAPFYYEKRVKQALQRLKFSSAPAVAETMAAYMLSVAFERGYTQADLVTWVPSKGMMTRKRGYEQAELLARSLSARSDGALPRPVRLLRKTGRAEHQYTLGAEERKKNVEGVFAFYGGTDVEGKYILLIDDIFTTGATVSECARVLKRAGAGKVDVVTAAKVPFGGEDRPKGSTKMYISQ